ncbi:MAG TPA: SGNH/GDSL hydrolase family protein [Candidatus Xenobia bacterium]
MCNLAARIARGAAAEHPTVLLGLGDSITAGYGASAGHSYFERLSQTLQARDPSLIAMNKAVSGTTSDGPLVALETVVLYGVDERGVVVMTTGGNDIIHNYGRSAPRELAMYGASWAQARAWIPGYGQRLDGHLSELAPSFPGGCQLYLANIYDPTDGHGDIEHAGLPDWPDGSKVLNAYNAVMDGFCRKHAEAHLVDLHRAFMGHGIHGTSLPLLLRPADPNYWYYSNLEDPNDRGYAVVYRTFLAAMVGK